MPLRCFFDIEISMRFGRLTLGVEKALKLVREVRRRNFDVRRRFDIEISTFLSDVEKNRNVEKWTCLLSCLRYSSLLNINPRLTRGGCCNPPQVFLRLHKNEKETDPGLLSNLFYIFCAHFDEKIGGTT